LFGIFWFLVSALVAEKASHPPNEKKLSDGAERFDAAID
jgi:hypothetical protein